MSLRASTVGLAAVIIGMLALAAAVVDAHRLHRARGSQVTAAAHAVRSLGLTDLALFNEARYTRHPAMADWHAPFQDHPLALEHFPTGSLFGHPHANLD